jgi:PIN domain nuclease of toxin-antitoxin system
MNYLLDTCTFLWYVQQPGMLSAPAVTALNDPASDLFVSDASLWEIALKNSAGKLPLPAALRTWIPQKLAFHLIQSLPLSHDDIFRSGELPGVHADPFDRLIVAQALNAALTVISPDAPLPLLGAARIW